MASHYPQQKFPKKAKKHFLDDKAYSKLAQWMISRYAPTYSQDTDLYDYVKYRLMVADSTWSKSKGAARVTHRFSYGKYAIRTYLYSARKQQLLSVPKTYQFLNFDDDYYNLTSDDNVMSVVIQQEIVECVQSAINKLNSQKRDIVLRYMDKQTFRTIGEAIGISYESVRTLYKQSLSELKEILGDKVFG